jgi:hypothetical protein
VPDPLANPFIELYASGPTKIAFNNDWRDTQETLIESTGLAPPDNLESAIDITLSPGTYTVVVQGNNSGTGVALMEVYDLDPGSSKLANISTRAFVSTGDDITIAGFILGSHAGPGRVIIRGLGPSLGSVGVKDPLPNPALELRDGNGALLIANKDWHDDSAQAAQMIKAGLGPPDNHEAGIAATLPPGPYTVLLVGESNSTGLGLVEVYDVGQ